MLYRHFDSAGTLLYVGISTTFISRLLSHVHGQRWTREIARIELQHFDTKAEAMAAESLAVKSENPRYNEYLTNSYRRSSRPSPLPSP